MELDEWPEVQRENIEVNVIKEGSGSNKYIFYLIIGIAAILKLICVCLLFLHASIF